MKIEKRWVISFVIISLISIAALFWPEQTSLPKPGTFLKEDNIVGSDVAWILASSGLVLLMTPGLSFFYGGMVGKKNVISTMLKFYCPRCD